MLDKAFKDIVSRNQADWGVVYLGCRGLTCDLHDLSPASVSDFACGQLALTAYDDESLPLISELALCSNIGFDIKDIIEKLCIKQKADLELAKKKWFLFTFRICINNMPEFHSPDDYEPLYDLYGFLSGWDYYIDTIGPNWKRSFFYPDSGYQEVILNIKRWVEKEINNLSSGLSQ